MFFVFFEKNAKKNANPKLEKYKMQKKYKTKIPKIQNAKKYKSKIGKIQNTKNNTKNTKPTSCISQTLQFWFCIFELYFFVFFLYFQMLVEDPSVATAENSTVNQIFSELHLLWASFLEPFLSYMNWSNYPVSKHSARQGSMHLKKKGKNEEDLWRNTRKHTSRARASRVTEVSKEGGNYKQNGEPIGTPADRLVVTSLDSGDVVMRWCGDSVMWSWCDVVIWWCGDVMRWYHILSSSDIVTIIVRCSKTLEESRGPRWSPKICSFCSFCVHWVVLCQFVSQDVACEGQRRKSNARTVTRRNMSVKYVVVSKMSMSHVLRQVVKSSKSSKSQLPTSTNPSGRRHPESPKGSSRNNLALWHVNNYIIYIYSIRVFYGVFMHYTLYDISGSIFWLL